MACYQMLGVLPSETARIGHGRRVTLVAVTPGQIEGTVPDPRIGRQWRGLATGYDKLATVCRSTAGIA